MLALHRRHARQRRSEHWDEPSRFPLREISFRSGNKVKLALPRLRLPRGFRFSFRRAATILHRLAFCWSSSYFHSRTLVQWNHAVAYHRINLTEHMSRDRKTESAEQKRHESEEQLSLLQTITTELTTAEDLSSALEVVLRDVCEKTGWVLGHAWVPNPPGTALDLVSAWYCGDGELKPFRTASEAFHFQTGVGLPGRVWKSKRPAWVENVTDDPNFPRSAAARIAGLKTGVGIPILSGDQVIAVLEFFMRESRAQNERLLNVIASVAAQLDLLHRATHAEAAARERQFRTLANSISQLAWMADSEGYIFWYNDRWYEYTGTTLEEMKGWGWQKVHHPDEVGRVVERIKVAFATGQPWEDTFPLKSKTGEYRWFLSRALPIFDAEGKVARWFGTNTDITEQRNWSGHCARVETSWSKK